MNESDSLTVAEAATRLDVPAADVLAWIADGRLHARGTGDDARIAVAELERFIAASEQVQDDGRIQSGGDIDLTSE